MKYLVGVFGFTLFGVITALSVYGALVALGDAEYLSFIFGTGLAVTGLTLTIVAAVPIAGRVRMRYEYGLDGTVFYPDRMVNLLASIAGVSLFIALLVYLICAAFDPVSFPLLSDDRRYFTWISAAALVTILPATKQIVTRGGRNYLRLAPNGIEFATSFATGDAGWDDLVEISDRPARGPRPLSSGTTFLTIAGRTKVLPTDWYVPRGAALRQLIQYYWEHPDHRDELLDGRAVERINRYQMSA